MLLTFQLTIVNVKRKYNFVYTVTLSCKELSLFTVELVFFAILGSKISVVCTTDVENEKHIKTLARKRKSEIYFRRHRCRWVHNIQDDYNEIELEIV
jgi:hypothetical protein